MMMVKGLWVGYKKSGAYIKSAWVMEDAVESFIRENIHTNKEIEIVEHHKPCIADENGNGTIMAWTNKGWNHNLRVR